MIGVIQCNGRPRVIFYIWCLARRKKQSGWQGFVSPRYCSILFNDFLSFSHYWLNTPILTGHTTASLFSTAVYWTENKILGYPGYQFFSNTAVQQTKRKQFSVSKVDRQLLCWQDCKTWRMLRSKYLQRRSAGRIFSVTDLSDSVRL